MKIGSDDRGILHLPLALLCVLLVITGLSFWGILHRWKKITQIQMRLDRCTGEAALDLKDKLRKVSSANQRIQELRIAEAAAEILPEAAQALKILIEAQAAYQEVLRVEWTAKQAKWIAQMGCGSFHERGDFMSPLPTLSWIREIPDLLGPRPIRLEQLPRSYSFWVNHPPRISAAEVFSGEKNDNRLTSPHWYARWIAPRKLLRTNLH